MTKKLNKIEETILSDIRSGKGLQSSLAPLIIVSDGSYIRRRAR